jgi:cytoskeletal protein CcmA (bactofilin family)
MFSKNSKSNRLQGPAPALALPPPSQEPTPAPCVISAEITVNGDISTIGAIQIDGTVTGDLRAAKVTIGQKATIRGDILAEEVIVRGHVVGMITGRRVQLSGTSYVKGDIRHESMGMDMGARLDGCCRHAADALALAAPAAPAALPKPVSLARAAMKTEDRSPAPAAEPVVQKAKLSLASAAAPAPDAIANAEAAKPPASGLEALKSTGLEMRARASKPASATSRKKPAAAKSSDLKPGVSDPVLPTEGTSAAPAHPSSPFGTRPGEVDLQCDGSPAPELLQRETLAS